MTTETKKPSEQIKELANEIARTHLPRNVEPNARDLADALPYATVRYLDAEFVRMMDRLEKLEVMHMTPLQLLEYYKPGSKP